MVASNPNWPFGYVPAPSEWNTWWGKKGDSNTTVCVTDPAYGAKGDGTTDDTNAIKAAVAAVAGGGAVYFPPGNYLVSGKVAIPSNVALFAQRGTAWMVSAPAASWGASGIDTLFYNSAVNSSNWTLTGTNINITVKGLGFTFPQGASNYGGGFAHILNFWGVTNLTIQDCISDGAANFVAIQGCTASKCDGNVITNVSNAGIDHWQGTTDASCTNNSITTLPAASAGCAAIQFTGINTDQTAATTTGFICTDNFIHIQHTNGQGIILNGHNSGGADDKILVANNKIVVDTGVASWGVLVTGLAHHGIITNNYFEGSVGNAAIGVFAAASSWTVCGNRVNTWIDNGSGTIQVTATASTIYGNIGYNCSPGPFIGTYDSTTVAFGNDTGTGVLTLDKAAITNGGTIACSTVNTAALTATSNPVFGWNGAAGTTVYVNGANAFGKVVGFETAGSARWYIGSDFTSETGSNSGANFIVYAVADDGTTVIFTPITITRSTGAVTFSGNVGFNNTTAIAKPTVSGSKGGNAALTSLVTALANYGLITNSTT